MDNRICYGVCVPMVGQIDDLYTLVRADTAEGAGEVVRILLAQGDPNITRLVIRVEIKLPGE